MKTEAFLNQIVKDLAYVKDELRLNNVAKALGLLDDLTDNIRWVISYGVEGDVKLSS